MRTKRLLMIAAVAAGIGILIFLVQRRGLRQDAVSQKSAGGGSGLYQVHDKAGGGATKIYQPVKPITRPVTSIPKPVKIIQPAQDYPRVNASVTKITQDLQDIIRRTRVLQDQARADRVRVDQILNRARAHEQIIKTLKPPQPIATDGTADVNTLVELEKLRLISEQTSEAEKQLKVLEAS